ncbi:MAG TPA: hypothetical protein VFB20_10970 [Burkholderiales bacterium]|nr:hypothetical protein [Burkholderiales bacterium]
MPVIDCTIRRRARLGLTAVLLVIVSGCATMAPPAPALETKEKAIEKRGTVAIVPAQYLPQSNFRAFAGSKPAGVTKSAAIAAAETASAIDLAAATGTGAAALSFLAPYALATGAIFGAVAGSAVPLPAETAQEIETGIGRSLAKLDAQRALADRLGAIVKKETWVPLRAVDAKGPAAANESPTYAALVSAGVDTVIETAVREIGFHRCDPLWLGGVEPDGARCPPDHRRKPTVSLIMLAQARLVRVADGTALLVRQFRYASPHRGFAQWAANDGRLLVEEFERAYRELAERVNDELLLVTPIDLPNFNSSWPPSQSLYGMCWLAPVYPKAERTAPSEALTASISGSEDMCLVDPLRFGTVDSLRPTLRWSAFPRDLDREKLDPGLLNKIRDVTYDLKIWEAEGCERGRLVYERTGLPAPEHRLETALEPGQRYFWSFRARFTVDGRPMAMRWAFYDPYSCDADDRAPEWSGCKYHRFMTPS